MTDTLRAVRDTGAAIEGQARGRLMSDVNAKRASVIPPAFLCKRQAAACWRCPRPVTAFRLICERV